MLIAFVVGDSAVRGSQSFILAVIMFIGHLRFLIPNEWEMVQWERVFIWEIFKFRFLQEK